MIINDTLNCKDKHAELSLSTNLLRRKAKIQGLHGAQSHALLKRTSQSPCESNLCLAQLQEGHGLIKGAKRQKDAANTASNRHPHARTLRKTEARHLKSTLKERVKNKSKFLGVSTIRSSIERTSPGQKRWSHCAYPLYQRFFL